MRLLQLLAVFASVLAIGCDSKHASVARESAESESLNVKWRGGPPPGWSFLGVSLEQCVARNPGRPIIVSFGARWIKTTEIHWRTLSIDGVTEALHKAGFICIAADLTHENQLGRAELELLHYSAVPVTAIYDPTTRKWEVPAELFTAENVIEWADSLSQRIAEQAGSGQSATRPEAKPERYNPYSESEGRSR